MNTMIAALLLSLLTAPTVNSARVSTPPTRPTASFTVTCAVGSLQCKLDASKSLNAIRYRFELGTSQPPELRAVVTNTWPAGTSCVRLWAFGAAGDSSYSTKQITLPYVKGATFGACKTVPPTPPARVDTVVRVVHDTIPCPCADTTTKPPVVPPPQPPTPPVQPSTPPAPPLPAPTGEVWAELPRVYLDTKLIPPTGKILSVPIGGNLQAALNAAQGGDVIELGNGGTWICNCMLPNKSGTAWITIRPANMANVPAEGTRMSPAAALAANLPKIVSPNNQGAIMTDFGAHHFRLVAVEVTVPANIQNTGLIRLGTGYETTVAQLPHDLIVDRLYIHGSPTGNLRRAVTLNGASSAVIDSYISEVHDAGQDSQAIWGASGPGPFKITNNYLEAASENINWGGADPAIQGMIPSDIEIRGNHMTKQPAWKGQGFNVKNLFEVKNAQRVLVEGNVFENNWADGQGGSAIVLKSVNQGGGCPWCVAKDITFRLNVIRSTGSGFALTGHDVGAQSIMTRVTITDNLVTTIDVAPFNGDGRGFLINNDPIDLTIAHNTVLDATNMAITFGGPDTLPPTRLIVRDNIIDGGQYGVKGPGIGTAAALKTFMPAGGFRGNLIITNDPTGLPAGTAVISRAAIAFMPDWALSATSPFRGKATTGRDPGANIGAVLAATAGVVQP